MSTDNRKTFGLKDMEKRLGKLTVGGFLRNWRMTEELSLKDFGKKVKLSSANLCDIEKGRKGISAEKAEQIAKAIGVTCHWIYDRINNGKISICKQEKTGLYLFPEKPSTLKQFRDFKNGKLKKLHY